MSSMKDLLIEGFINKINIELLNNPTEEKLLHLIKCINEVKDKCPDKTDFLEKEFNQKISKCYDDILEKRKVELFNDYIYYCNNTFHFYHKDLKNVSSNEVNSVVECGRKIDELMNKLKSLKVELSNLIYVEKTIRAPSHYMPWARSEEMIRKDIAIVRREKDIEDLTDREKEIFNNIKSKILEIELQIEKIKYRTVKEMKEQNAS